MHFYRKLKNGQIIILLIIELHNLKLYENDTFFWRNKGRIPNETRGMTWKWLVLRSEMTNSLFYVALVLVSHGVLAGRPVVVRIMHPIPTSLLSYFNIFHIMIT